MMITVIIIHIMVLRTHANFMHHLFLDIKSAYKTPSVADKVKKVWGFGAEFSGIYDTMMGWVEMSVSIGAI